MRRCLACTFPFRDHDGRARATGHLPHPFDAGERRKVERRTASETVLLYLDIVKPLAVLLALGLVS